MNEVKHSYGRKNRHEDVGTTAKVEDRRSPHYPVEEIVNKIPRLEEMDDNDEIDPPMLDNHVNESIDLTLPVADPHSKGHNSLAIRLHRKMSNQGKISTQVETVKGRS
ncbi:hypothetical protein Fot_42356 [Forsythia ovata]|uniref:Uncharacterized protein n=1 Tax=Forsythia ovata TaxID=205694 RepID=A0ABD1RKX5_9LAMI